MSGAAKSRYGFGQNQGWFDDEAAEAPAPKPDREEFIRKVQEGAASVGYVAPSEVVKPAEAVTVPAPATGPALEVKVPATTSTPAPKHKREPRAKVVQAPEPDPESELEGRKGRPKGDRTIQMSVRIKQEHDELIKAIARDDFSVASIVEAALVAFAKGIYADKKYKRMPLDEETLALAKSIFTQQRH